MEQVREQAEVWGVVEAEAEWVVIVLAQGRVGIAFAQVAGLKSRIRQERLAHL